MAENQHPLDSVSQFVLGAAVATASLRRDGRPLRAVLWGGLLATLPDLDVLIDHGSALENMVRHRGHSHSLIWLSLVAPLFAFGIASLHGERRHFRRWWLACWLALVTHPLLDALTIYGTQLWQPFSDHPVAIGSLFIVDPLYTLPLLVGTGLAALSRGRRFGYRANTIGLLLSTAYAAFSLAAQQHVLARADADLRRQGVVVERLLATAAPFQTVVFRVVAFDAQHSYEGFVSLLDDDRPVEFERFDRGVEERSLVADLRPVRRLEAFSHGFVHFERRGDEVTMADVRMGLHPSYFFTFAVATVAGDDVRPIEPPRKVPGERLDLGPRLRWLGRRMGGERIPPPR